MKNPIREKKLNGMLNENLVKWVLFNGNIKKDGLDLDIFT